jgi:hypothetical protein
MSKHCKTFKEYITETQGGVSSGVSAFDPTGKQYPLNSEKDAGLGYRKRNEKQQKMQKLDIGATFKEKLAGDKDKHHEPITHAANRRVLGIK